MNIHKDTTQPTTEDYTESNWDKNHRDIFIDGPQDSDLGREELGHLFIKDLLCKYSVPGAHGDSTPSLSVCISIY